MSSVFLSLEEKLTILNNHLSWLTNGEERFNLILLNYPEWKDSQEVKDIFEDIEKRKDLINKEIESVTLQNEK